MATTTGSTGRTSWKRWILLPANAGRERNRRYLWIIALTSAGFALAFAASTGARPSGLEIDVFRAVNGLPDWLTPALIVAVQAGGLGAIFVVAGLALILWRPRLSVAILVAGLAVYVLAKVVKRNIERGRPVEYLHDVIIHGPAQVGLGFPSGHAAVAGAMATVASPYLTRPMRAVVWTLAGLVVFTRVFIGAHLPLDTVGGFLLGCAVGSVVNLIAGTPAEAPPLREERRTPDAAEGPA